MPIPPDLQIFYPNGGVTACQMYIWDGSKPVVWDGSGGGGGGAVTIADGADVALGSTTDVAVDGDAAGTVNAHLRGISKKLAASVAITAASLPLPTGASTLTEQQSQTSVLGATNGAAVTTDVNGTIQQYLRGLIKLAITAGGFLTTTVLSAGSALIGKVGIDQTTNGTTNAVAPVANAAAGLSTMNASSSDGATALTNSAQVIKASAGSLYGYYIYNPNNTAAFVQFYNVAAASVTVGTTNPLFMLTIPPGSGANLLGAIGINFSNAGWSWAATSTSGGNGALTTALDAIAWYA